IPAQNHIIDFGVVRPDWPGICCTCFVGKLAVNDQNEAAIVAAGGIPPLIALVTSGSDSAKENAVYALANLAWNDENKAAIAAAGGIPPLVALITSGSDSAKKYAAGALANLTGNSQNEAAIAAAGGIPPLVALITRGSDSAKEHAARALRNLAVNDQNGAAIAAAGGIPPLVALITSGSDSAKEHAARALGNLAVNDQNRAAIVAAGGIPPLVALITSGSDSAKERAAGAAIAAAGGIPPLVTLITSGSDSAKVYAAAALGNLARTDQNRAAIVYAAAALGNLARTDQNRAAIAAAGGIPPLIALVTSGSDSAKENAALALGSLATNDQNRAAIMAAGGVQAIQEMAKDGKMLVHRQVAQEALKHFPRESDSAEGGDPATKPSTIVSAEKLRGEIRTLESGNEELKAKAAEKLGTWAAVSDENRVAISREGGAEALVALLVTGSDDAKWHAARALRNLANNFEAKDVILKAGGIATLEPLVRHGKGKVKEAADEALKILSQKQETKSIQATGHGKIAEAGDKIPTGEGARVAMFSARFDGGPIEQKIRKVFQILCARKYDILMVTADAGQSFGDLTTKYLGRLRKENGTMIAVCTKHYGEMTASAYSSHKELKFALDYEKFVTVLPLRVDDTYPPEPPGNTARWEFSLILEVGDQEFLAEVWHDAMVKGDGSSDGSVDPFESDKLTAKASRMVPWHSLVSASRASEEDLEPDAVPEAVPEADGYGFACSRGELADLQLASLLSIDFSPWQQKYAVQMDSPWAFGKPGNSGRLLQTGHPGGPADAPSTRGISFTQPGATAAGAEAVEDDKGAVIAEILKATAWPRPSLPATEQFIRFSPLPLGAGNLRKTLPARLSLSGLGFRRVLACSTLPRGTISLPPGLTDFNLSITLHDFFLGLPVSASSVADRKLWTVFEPLAGANEASCTKSCEENLDCLTSFPGYHGCFEAYNNHSHHEATAASSGIALAAGNRTLRGQLAGCRLLTPNVSNGIESSVASCTAPTLVRFLEITLRIPARNRIDFGVVLPDWLEASDREKEEAAKILANLAVNDENKAAIAAAGGIPPLVALVTRGSDSAKKYAARALGNLASNNDQNKAAIAAAGGIPPLVALVTSGNDSAKEYAAAALGNLATNDQNKAAIAAAGGIPPLVALVTSGSDSAKQDAARALGKLATRIDQNKATIAAAGGIPPLVALVTSGSDSAKQDAARALANLATNDQNEAAIVAAGGIPPLVALVTSGSDSAKQDAARALRNLATNDQNEAAIAAAGGIPPLVALVTSGSDSAKQDAARVLGNLASNDQNEAAIAAAGGIPPLVALVTCGSDSAKAHAARALGNLASKNDQNKAAIAAAGGIPPLVALVTSGSDSAKEYAARALGNLASKNDQNKAAIMAAGGVQALQEMAKDGKVLVHRQMAQGALKHLPRESDSAEGGTKLGSDPATKPSTIVSAEKLRGEIRTLESGNQELKAKAAEQLGTWAAVSDENRVAISREGGAEALVALLVTGSDDAKWHAARALRNLANNCEAKEVILKAGGIATLEPVVRHGKGKVKEAADEALKLLSQKQETKSIQATGHGRKIRKVFQILCDRKYDILMVAADAGQSFGDLTTKYLGRLHKENGTMIAVCTEHYGEMTASAYSSHKELKFALDYEKFVTVLPLRVDDTYPPEPPGGPGHAYDKEYLARGYILSVFKPSVVFLECREKSEIEIAAQIANVLQRHKVGKDGSS
ncbi:unnamed protein product, partial [Cladocopium goreaui]